MSALWKQVWDADSSVFDQLDTMTPDQVNTFFVVCRGEDQKLLINYRLVMLYSQGKTSPEQFSYYWDPVTHQTTRYRQFVNLAAAQEHKEWHEANISSIYPPGGPATWTLTVHEVVDNVDLSQV